MNISNLTFTPFGGWILFTVFAVVILGVLVYEFIHAARTRSSSEATALDWARRGLIGLIGLLMLAGPSTVVTTNQQAINSTDVFFAVDITTSMAVDDAQYGSTKKITRLAAAQQAVDDLITQFPGSSFAGTSFGASSSLDVPLTPDAHAITSWVDGLQAEPTDISQGSSLDEPLDSLLITMQQTRALHPNSRIILYYISDGEQTSVSNRRTFSSLRAFVDAGAVIGVGSSAGGQVPVISLDSLDSSESAADETVKWVMDPTTNKPALSKMDKDSLTAIADEYSASTILLDASTTAKDLTIEASKDFQIASTPRKTSYTNYLIWPLALVELALMIWEAGIILSRFRRTI